ncbi:MAG: heme exporter protein CcmD [Pseudomonadales bacterium]|nr:heme exporter protein CcmD [Pseudomonadales bacterium]
MPELQFSSLGDFLEMGGYALYVWSAYSIFAVFVAVNLIQPYRARRKFMKQQRARLEREEQR